MQYLPDHQLTKHWNELALEFFRIQKELSHCIKQLADLGIILKDTIPKITNADTMTVVRIKEKMITLENAKATIFAQINHNGGRLFDESTFEILVPQFPFGTIFFSWCPGENDFLYLRNLNLHTSHRQPIAEIDMTLLPRPN